MKNNLKIAVISVIGLLTLTVISAMTINSVPVVKADRGNCDGDGVGNCKDEAYGGLISHEAKTGSAGDKKGYGDEVSPLAKDKSDGSNGMKQFREAGSGGRTSGVEEGLPSGSNVPGKSGQEHRNDD